MLGPASAARSRFVVSRSVVASVEGSPVVRRRARFTIRLFFSFFFFFKTAIVREVFSSSRREKFSVSFVFENRATFYPFYIFFLW